MQDTITETVTTIYCVCAQVLEAMGFEDDPRSRVSEAEIMLVPLVSALYHASNHAKTRAFLKKAGFVKHPLGASRFCRRLHRVPQGAWEWVFSLLSRLAIEQNPSGDYAIDSMPVLVCQNARIQRCRLFPVEDNGALRGKQASKKRYFYGFKVHLIVTRGGAPVEFFISEGSMHDLQGLRQMTLDLPAGSTLWGDKAYGSQNEQEFLQQVGDIRLIALKRSNSKTPLPQCLVFLCQTIRQSVETAFGEITKCAPVHLHAVTPAGFLLKIQATILAYAFQKALY